MKKFTKRLAAIAMTAIMGISSAAMTGEAAVGNLFTKNAIVAEAAGEWYPVLSDFTFCRSANYASVGTTAVKTALSNALGTKVTNSNGIYRNYGVLYSKKKSSAGYSDEIIVLYDRTKRPQLDTYNTRIREWMEKQLQFINTEKQMSGISNPYLIMIMDAKNNNGSYITNQSSCSGNVTSYCTSASQEFVDGIIGFSNLYQTWSVLHECSSAYKNAAQSLFLTNDSVFTNLRTICAIRELKRSGLSYPDVLRPQSNGNLVYGGRKYTGASAFQYCCHDMKGDREDYYLPLTINQINAANNGSGHQLLYARAGFLFELATGLNPCSNLIQTNRTFADELETYPSYDSCWVKAYALCISNPNNVNAVFMRQAKHKYVQYADNQMYTIVVRLRDGWVPTTPQPVTPRVQSLIMEKYGKSGGAYGCTLGTLRAFNTYDFLFGDSNSTAFINHMDETAFQHNTITYWTICERIVGKYN